MSGDLIHGGDSADEIRAQYAETKSFLTSIVDHFLEHDKRRILIVPGNHDMSFPHSGTGRIGRLMMRPMSLWESGESRRY